MPGHEIDVDSGRARSEMQVVRAMFGAFARRDVEGALPYAHPHLEFTAPGTAALAGRDGPYRGTMACASTSATSSRYGMSSPWTHRTTGP